MRLGVSFDRATEFQSRSLVSAPENSDDVRLPSINRRPEVSRKQTKFPSGVRSPQIQISTPFPTPRVAVTIYFFIFTSSDDVPKRRGILGPTVVHSSKAFVFLILGGYVHFHLAFYT